VGNWDCKSVGVTDVVEGNFVGYKVFEAPLKTGENVEEREVGSVFGFVVE